MVEESQELIMRIATAQDHQAAEDIRQASFEPVFASFKHILGNKIYDLAQAEEDRAQEKLLAELFDENSEWELYIAEYEGAPVGFLSLNLDPATHVGEIGLNAIHPDSTGNGLGTKMYEFALQRMRESGMKVATVATGGDPSHHPARAAYRKAGFDKEIPSVWMCKLLD